MEVLMTKQVKQLERHIESVIASLDLLDCFLQDPRLTIKVIIEQTGMTRNRVSRILGTLIHKGYVMEGVEPNTFTTGPKLMALGKVFENNQNLVALARPVLRELVLTTGESATFYIREGQERVVIAREEGTEAIRFSVQVGQRMDLHAGAAGKVLLAYLSETERNIILTSKPLAKRTSATITNPNALIVELKNVKRNGYAISKGERNPDSFSLAAPVFERKDLLLGAISVAGPISRWTPETEIKYLGALTNAAAKLSSQFGLSVTQLLLDTDETAL
jgi:DNA-binding IclR family transcriptional regulator